MLSEREQFSADEFREWFRVVRTWSGSAFLAGEKVADEAEHKSQLYSDLCSLGNYLDCWADIAEAQAPGLATRQLTAPGSTAPPEAISPPPPPGGVEELVERLLAEHVRKINRVVAAGMHERDAIRHAAEAISAPLARLLEERTRERDEQHARAERLEQKWWDSAVELKARAETAERLLEEVEGALREMLDMCAPWTDAANDPWRKARQALSIVRKEKGSSQGCPTSSAPPFANHAPEVPTAAAVSPGKEG